MLANFRFETVMSLGVDCRVRFQIARHFDAARATPPPGQATAASLPEYLKGTNFFDWHITWFADVIRALENRFEGVFNPRQLKPSPNDASVAVDGRYNFRYFHAFSAAEGVSFDEMVGTQFEAVAPKIWYLRDKLLSHLAAENPTLYVRCQGNEEEAKRFCQVINRVYPAHRFHLLVVDIQDETAGFVSLQDDYSIYRMNGRVRKPPARAWSGDNEEWSDMFRQVQEAERLVAQA